MVETVHAVFDVIDQAENLEETQGLLLAMVALIEQYMIDNGATKHQAAALVRRALRAS